MKWKDTLCTLKLTPGPAARPNRFSDRLAEAVSWLEYLDRKRVLEGDPHYGKTIEERIIWRELLDLELQQVDEEIERLCANAHKG